MVFERIQEIIADKLGLDPDDITEETSFDELEVDSLYMVEIMMAIEEEFSITIDESDGLVCVGDIVRYTEAKLR